MRIEIKDRAELKRIRKLLTTLDNKTASFPIMLYRAEDQTVAFIHGNMDREFSVTTEGTTQSFQFSDRSGARLEWIDKEFEEMKARVDALNK